MQPPRPTLPRTPICLALVAANTVSVDRETGVVSIIGTYSYVEQEDYPFTYYSIEVYAILTECDGDVLVELRLTDVNDARPPVFRNIISKHFGGPKDVQELVFHQFQVTIPTADEYLLQLYVHGPQDSLQGGGTLVLERALQFN